MNYNLETGKPTYLVLSLKFWVLTLLLVLTYSVIIFAQTTVYVNPENGGDPAEDGSIDHPFDSWTDVAFQDNSTYLQKRGTTASGCFDVRGRVNVVIGAYGDGERPVITGVPGSTISIMTLSKATNYTIRDIKFVGHYPDSPTAAIYAYGNWSPSGFVTSNFITIKNCDISYCYNGIRILPLQTDIDDVTVDSCTIHHVNEEGMFVRNCSNFVCRNTHIYMVNQDWHHGPHDINNAPGDGIQLDGDCDNFLIEKTIIDRRNTGLKFCIIHNEQNGGYGNDGIIRDCVFYPPKDTIGQVGSSGGALFIYTGDTLILERVKIIGRDRIYSAPGDGDHGGSAGELGYDHIIMKYCLGDSTGVLRTNMYNDDICFNNCTWATNVNGLGLYLTGGLTYVKNSVIAAGPNATINLGVSTVDSTIIYQSDMSNWDSYIGFIDSYNGDYHLTSTSIAVDKAITLGYSYDIDSVPVPQGVLPDLGACEYIDGGQSNNNPPTIDDQFFNVNENSANGVAVGTVIASDPDAGQTISFSITYGNTGNAFAIDQVSGVITVNSVSALNFENNPVFNLIVQVVDNASSPLSANADIVINLNDINEPPSISNQSFSLDENSANGSTVGTVLATDPDNGQTLNYSI
ncbi:MAG: cadherin domain-containing protein, partial [Bacteroidales bacterium]|nr:cadherin domain-containing protein [Bacteroidales bacterium]